LYWSALGRGATSFIYYPFIMQLWLTLALLTILFAAGSVNLQRYLMDRVKVDKYLVIFFFQVFTATFFFILWMARGGEFNQIAVLKDYIPNLFLMTIFYTAVNLSNFNALKHIDSSKFSIISSTSNIFVIIFSSIFLSKSILPYQFIGVLLVFAGIVILNYRLFKANSLKEIMKLGVGEILAFTGAISLGAGITNDSFLITKIDLYLYLSIAFLLPAVVMPLISPKSFSNIEGIKKFLKFDNLKWAGAFALSYTLQAYTFYRAIESAQNPALVASVTLSSVIFIGIGAYIFLKEREELGVKLISALLTVVGLLIITN
jgi:drug/metabolite transporter (DMT)-like permease